MTLAAYDFLEVESLQGEVSEGERDTRVELAAAFRIAVSRDWNKSTANHMTTRVPDQPDCFLMNAADFAWGEVSASNLLKLDMGCNVVSDTDRKPCPGGRNFHSALQRERDYIDCTVHIHPGAGVVGRRAAVFRSRSCGVCGQAAYHDYEGLAQDADEVP